MGHRIEAIDLARGIAVCLMILSHGVNGLLVSFDQFTDWGLVPVHAVTKFSSSLFILVFGIALAVVYVPRTGSPDWPRLRLKLLLAGLVVLFWYKMLTVVEMIQNHPPAAIVDALLYRGFPSYVEILGFYAIALLWLPFVLPFWAKAPAMLRWASPVLLGLVSWLLLRYFDFWGSETLQALLVEHPDYYTWGQLARGPLVLLGLLIGGEVVRRYRDPIERRKGVLVLAAASAVLFAAFFWLVHGDTAGELRAIALNAGKHPPELAFMLFSVGGALGILALVGLGGERLATILRPVTIIGQDALKAFVFHIVVIFLVLRYLLGYLGEVDYARALAMTLAVMAATVVWIRLTAWVARRRGR